MRFLPVLSVLVLAAACSDYNFADQKDEEIYAPIILVEPQAISFGSIDPGLTASESFTISNIGDALLDIEGLEIMGSSTFALTAIDLSEGLAPEESMDVVVEYTPEEAGSEDSGSVLISSSDPATPMVEVTLWGGVDMPLLSISPNPLDLGNVRVGESDSGTLTLSSTGQAPVTISDFDITGHAFSGLEAETWPLTLDPGSETTIEITFEPQGGGDFEEIITVDCDAPAEDASATLTGSAEDAGAVAVCSVDPTEVEPNAGSATWIGRESYDTAGYAITDYDWTLVSAPGGSTATMPVGASADRSPFQPDLAGEYVGELIVTNELGMASEPCQATLTATPVEDMWIQMYWTHSGDDMDLHLLKPGGNLETQGDCYYSNCVGSGLDWGVSGDPSDNPSLDMDDIPGTGPENINIQSPETGTFTVYVHDYTGGNDTTVVIFLGGYQVWSDTRTISGESSYTAFAEIDWPSGLVTSL